MKIINTNLAIRLMRGVLVVALLCGLGSKAQGQSIRVQYPSPRYFHADVPFDTIQSPDMYTYSVTYSPPDFAWYHFFEVFHCDEPVDIAGIAFSGYLNECRHKDAKAWLYLIGFEKQSGNGEMVILDSVLYNAEKEPVILEYPFTRGADSTAPALSIPLWEMLFANTHVVSDSFAVAFSNFEVEGLIPDPSGDCHEYIGDCYIDSYRCGARLNAFSPDNPRQSLLRAEHDYVIDEWFAGMNNTIGEILDEWGLERTAPARYAYEGEFEPILASSCPTMQSVRIDSTDATQAWISWPSSDSAATYRVEYMLHGGHFGDGQWVTGITDTFCCIQGLTPGMAYDIYVQAFCPGQQQYGLPSAPVMTVIGDMATCPDVQNLHVSWRNPNLGVAALAFDSLPDHLRYQISICPYDCGSPDMGHIYDVYDNPYYLLDLDTNIYYAAYARAQCSHSCFVHHDSLFWGGWGEPIYFYLGHNNPLGITPTEAAAFTVTPNPARDNVTVTLGDGCDRTHATLMLRDAAGKELRRLTPSAATVEVPLLGLPAGTYFLTLATPQGSSTQKLLIEP
ncbi:MAG: T9SS type A sorting domain-containing protein [Bacteroidales bacterium]|nr:T9SS type A sorting domain-containing protein [Bacteroidales bacterium]